MRSLTFISQPVARFLLRELRCLPGKAGVLWATERARLMYTSVLAAGFIAVVLAH